MNTRFLTRAALAAATLVSLSLLAALPAQSADEGLYGPAAPPGSAFIRVFNATTQGPLTAKVGDQELSEIASYGATEFVFLPAGQYTLAIGSTKQPVTLRKDRYYTAAFTGKSIRLLDNERFENKLKSQVILYNLLDDKSVTLKTADGRPVIENVASNAFGTREVNAVRVSMAVFDGQEKLADVNAVTLERGRALSLFVIGDGSKPLVVTALD